MYDGEATTPTLVKESLTKHPASLEVFLNGRSAWYELPPEAALTVGRSRMCDVYIDDPSVSRKHAIIYTGKPPRVDDCNSTNGTFLGELRLTPGESRSVPPGTVLAIGEALLLIRPEPGSNTPAPRRGDVRPPPHFMEEVGRIAKSRLNVLVLGETGAGKERVAKTLHDLSRRAKKPFEVLNCAAIPHELFESELFGTESGAFTGAKKKPGLIELANEGTMFLDEIGEMPLTMQAKLLRVIETGELMRVGDTRRRSVDVRYIAATNRDLVACCEVGTFRQDLYYRLAKHTIVVPPLRDRRDEIHVLAETFVENACRADGRSRMRISSEAMTLLVNHSWPGNVRELCSVIERAVELCDGDTIGPEHLPLASPTGGKELSDVVEAFERQQILKALERNRWNVTEGAKELMVPRTTLYYKMAKFGITGPRSAGRGRQETQK